MLILLLIVVARLMLGFGFEVITGVFGRKLVSWIRLLGFPLMLEVLRMLLGGIIGTGFFLMLCGVNVIILSVLLLRIGNANKNSPSSLSSS